MKKLGIIAVSLLVARVASCWATVVTTGTVVFGPVPITFSGSLNTKAKVTDSTLTGITGVGSPLEFAVAQTVSDGVTDTVYVIGTGLGVETVISDSTTSSVIVGTIVYSTDDTVTLSTKNSGESFEGAFREDGSVLATNGVSSIKSNLDTVISNSVLLVTGSGSDPSKGSKSTTNASAKVSGIWYSGQSVLTSGSIKTAK